MSHSSNSSTLQQHWCQCPVHRSIAPEQNSNQILARGDHGNALGWYSSPSFVALDSQADLLFVTDSGNHRVVVLKPHDLTPLATFGLNNSGLDDDRFHPTGICVDSDAASVIVCDSCLDKIHVFQRYTDPTHQIDLTPCDIDEPHIASPSIPYYYGVKSSIGAGWGSGIANLNTPSGVAFDR